MKKRILPLVRAGRWLLSGCGLLRREYTRTEPHSATYYEGDRRDVLRAEGRQDLVNDLLLLVSAHDESGTVWLYDSEDGADASQLAQVACDEVLQETPLGAYALEYLTYTVDEGGRGYTQLRFTAGYRRTAQQIKSIVHATNAAALRDLRRPQWKTAGGSWRCRWAALTAAANRCWIPWRRSSRSWGTVTSPGRCSSIRTRTPGGLWK